MRNKALPLRPLMIAAASVALMSIAACNRGEDATPAQVAGSQADAQTRSAGDRAFAAVEQTLRTELDAASGDTIDEAYISRMLAHHRSAVAMADVALANSRDPGILRMAQTVKDTQTAEIAEMQAWEPAPPVPVAPAMTEPTAAPTPAEAPTT